MEREGLLRNIDRVLGDRALVWAGIRGEDVEPISDLPQLSGAFSIMSRYSRRASVEGVAYEELSGRRVDPEIWDIDDHLGAPSSREFRRGLLRALNGPSALLPYRPSQFLSGIAFARRDRCLNLGMWGAHQSAFDHKPWVETSIAALGIPHIPWVYIADEEQLSVSGMFDGRPIILRRSRTSGGEGMVRVDDPSRIVEHWPNADEGFASVGPYLSGGVPVNVGATVWKDGVTVHRPSVQLIGIPGAVTRPFGYAGNDFGLVKDMERSLIDEIESSTVRIGLWLKNQGYRGSFGVDYLIHEGRVLFTEVNPRFQGSTHASARLSVEEGEACLLLEHIAAHLDMPQPRQRPLWELVQQARDLAHLIVHWNGAEATALDCAPLVVAIRDQPGSNTIELVPGPAVICEPGAAIVRWTTRRRLTADGYSLLPEVADIGSPMLVPISTELES